MFSYSIGTQWFTFLSRVVRGFDPVAGFPLAFILHFVRHFLFNFILICRLHLCVGFLTEIVSRAREGVGATLHM